MHLNNGNEGKHQLIGPVVERNQVNIEKQKHGRREGLRLGKGWIESSASDGSGSSVWVVKQFTGCPWTPMGDCLPSKSNEEMKGGK